MDIRKKLGIATLALTASFAQAAGLDIKSAEDWGSGHSTYNASKTIDGSLAWSSRWAASGSPVHLVLDLGSVQTVDDVGISWGKGGDQTHSFEIWARASTSNSWTKIRPKGNTTGATSSIETYGVDDIDARYVRIKTHSNSAGSSWTNIKEVEIYGTESSGGGSGGGGTTPPTGSASYPSDLMDNYKQWKITYPNGIEDKTLYQEENEYFYVNNAGNAIVFRAPVRSNNGTTPNSDYIRSELRERTSDGGSDIYWTTSGTHVVYAKQAITHLPIVKDHIVATQIHGNKDDGIDDALVLRLEGSHLFLSFNGGKLRSDVTVKTNYSLGTVHEVMFEVINGKHYVYYSEDGNLKSAYASGNADKYLVKDGSNDYVMNKSYGEAYFKVGNYTQSNAEKEGSYTDNSNNYGEVVVYDFYVSHD